ncbi:BamA/TamA family outer membrane protein [Bacteroides sp. 519]|uniref:translocation and assembly module lipoprotein TamL n=1 Tax=Bacteroides sp. 519 TaxID=2302937 RepID=UPI0013D6BF31|nr:BamA/TamA family outer membrane protein [Bacteroides sp. 519]NDV59744.1 hypothetical protein [Bacteroides sp. 519]
MKNLSFLIIILLLASCSSTKFVPEGAYLLDNVKIQTDNRKIKKEALEPYVRQNPNSKWFSLFKTQLHIYSLSGRDSTKWINKVLRKMGQAPVLYDRGLAMRSEEEMTKAVHNMGYMSAQVEKIERTKKKKLSLTYKVTSGKPYIVRSLYYNIEDHKIAKYLTQDSANTYLKKGMVLDVNVLDAERQRITKYLLSNGYYKFNKDYINYEADTVRNTYEVDLTLHLNLYKHTGAEPQEHSQYAINKVNFIADYDPMQTSVRSSIEINDSIHYRGYPIYFKDGMYMRPKVLLNNLRIQPGELYNEKNVQSTYNNFGRLSALKYTNIRFAETQVGDTTKLNAYILLTKSKHQSVSFELDGTNSAGDLGAAASVTYQHRNIFKGSERFMVKFRGAYEAISGLSKEDYSYDNYREWGVETTVNFPRFLFPFLTSKFKRGIRATTEFGLQYNYQIRPEFSRTVLSGSWGYKWTQRDQRVNHRFDLIDVNYLYMPWKSPKFEEDYLNDEKKNYILAYNYKDRFIVRMGYMYNYNSIGAGLNNNTIASNSYTIRAGVESAGNVLFAFSKMLGLSKNADGEYSIFNIPFAQYLKFDFDFAKNMALDQRNSIAYHVGLGVAVPYGNADVVPFEKQYFSGGANSVRGWSVRSLGPGTFPGDGNFLNQSGDIKFDASIELRSRLFWKFQGAFFIDAGNIWSIRNYESQPGGKFYFDKFYKQIAVAYGLGLRLDFDFFVIRFDGGMKALNPEYESGKKRYPIIHPNFKRDFAFHFAVGYPF